MKKLYKKPEAKKVEFHYSEVVAASAGCNQGWTNETTSIPWPPEIATCDKCEKDYIWIGFTDF